MRPCGPKGDGGGSSVEQSQQASNRKQHQPVRRERSDEQADERQRPDLDPQLRGRTTATSTSRTAPTRAVRPATRTALSRATSRPRTARPRAPRSPAARRATTRSASTTRATRPRSRLCGTSVGKPEGGPPQKADLPFGMPGGKPGDGPPKGDAPARVWSRTRTRPTATPRASRPKARPQTNSPTTTSRSRSGSFGKGGKFCDPCAPSGGGVNQSNAAYTGELREQQKLDRPGQHADPERVGRLGQAQARTPRLTGEGAPRRRGAPSLRQRREANTAMGAPRTGRPSPLAAAGSAPARGAAARGPCRCGPLAARLQPADSRARAQTACSSGLPVRPRGGPAPVAEPVGRDGKDPLRAARDDVEGRCLRAVVGER